MKRLTPYGREGMKDFVVVQIQTWPSTQGETTCSLTSSSANSSGGTTTKGLLHKLLKCFVYKLQG